MATKLTEVLATIPAPSAADKPKTDLARWAHDVLAAVMQTAIAVPNEVDRKLVPIIAEGFFFTEDDAIDVFARGLKRVNNEPLSADENLRVRLVKHRWTEVAPGCPYVLETPTELAVVVTCPTGGFLCVIVKVCAQVFRGKYIDTLSGKEILALLCERSACEADTSDGQLQMDSDLNGIGAWHGQGCVESSITFETRRNPTPKLLWESFVTAPQRDKMFRGMGLALRAVGNTFPTKNGSKVLKYHKSMHITRCTEMLNGKIASEAASVGGGAFVCGFLGAPISSENAEAIMEYVLLGHWAREFITGGEKDVELLKQNMEPYWLPLTLDREVAAPPHATKAGGNINLGGERNDDDDDDSDEDDARPQMPAGLQALIQLLSHQ